MLQFELLDHRLFFLHEAVDLFEQIRMLDGRHVVDIGDVRQPGIENQFLFELQLVLRVIGSRLAQIRAIGPPEQRHPDRCFIVRRLDQGN